MQIPLSLRLDAAPTFDNFIVGANQELCQLLMAPVLPPIVFLWGETGVGCSHLLAATAALHSNARFIQSDGYEKGAVHLLDNAQEIDASLQAILFSVLKRLTQDGSSLIVAARESPIQLAQRGLREDVLTRFSSGPVFQVSPLSDQDKARAVQSHAKERGFDFPDEVLHYCLTHFARDMRSLMALLNALDQYSLQQRRHITLPLLRHFLARYRDEFIE